MGAGTVAGGTNATDLLTLNNGITHRNHHTAQVGIEGNIAVAMADLNALAVDAMPACADDGSAGRGVEYFPLPVDSYPQAQLFLLR